MMENFFRRTDARVRDRGDGVRNAKLALDLTIEGAQGTRGIVDNLN